MIVRDRFARGLLVLAVPALGSGCSVRPREAAPEPAKPVVTVAEAKRQTVAVRANPIGTTRAIQSVTIRARVRGILQEQRFREGAMVKKGDLLFVIEEDQYKASLDVAIGKRDEAAASLERVKVSKAPRVAQAQLDLDRASLKLARIEEARTRALFDRKATSQAEFDKARADLDKAAAQVESDQAKLEQETADYDVDIASAKAALESAEASVRQARIDLGYCRMSSPIDGRIGEAKVKLGNLVGPASGGGEMTELASVQQLDPMGVDVEVPSRYLSRATRLVKAGLPITMTKEGVPGEPVEKHSGIANFIDNTIDPNTSTFLIKGTVANPEGSLLPGEYVKADIVVDQLKDALVVPEAAIVETQAGPTVYTVDDSGRVDVVPVKVGVVDDGIATIQSGIEPGTRVIVGRLAMIRPGDTVKAVPQGEAVTDLGR